MTIWRETSKGREIWVGTGDCRNRTCLLNTLREQVDLLNTSSAAASAVISFRGWRTASDSNLVVGADDNDIVDSAVEPAAASGGLVSTDGLLLVVSSTAGRRPRLFVVGAEPGPGLEDGSSFLEPVGGAGAGLRPGFFQVLLVYCWLG